MSCFQSHANNEDWFATICALANVAGQFVAATKSGPDEVICADIGAGFCYSLRDLIGLVHFQTRIPTYWYAYEPDNDLVNIISAKTLPDKSRPRLPGLASVTSKLPELLDQCRNTCSVVTLMHSVYYCQDAVSLVQTCLDDLLVQNGAVILLQLNEQSPFYLFDEFRPPNRTYSLTSAFPQTRVVSRSMRFHIIEEIARNTEFQRHMYALMSRGRTDIPDFQTFSARFVDVFGKNKIVDLCDEILIIPNS